MNVLSPKALAGDAVCRTVDDPAELSESFAAYMTDESRLAHTLAKRIYFPTTTEEAAAAVCEAAQHGQKVVVSGGRTGIVGGAVVAGPCALLSLERLKPNPVIRFDSKINQWFVRAGAGMTVAELASALKSNQFDVEDRKPERELFYPVDPTETSAQLGGTVATNASGARTLFCGPTRKWVEWMRVVLADGRVLDLRRGDVTADGLEFKLEELSGKPRVVVLPDIVMPPTKATVGYMSAPGMDAVDLFVGSEGTLGIITEVELVLIERPPENLYLCQYFDGEGRALDFVHALIEDKKLSPLAVEYLDGNSLNLLRRKRKDEGASSGVPALPAAVRAVVYTEFALDGNGAFERTAERLGKVISQLGASSKNNWAGPYRADLEGMKKFRHALPETVNTIIAQRKAAVPEIHKVGTDMAVPFGNLREMLSVYRSNLDASGLEYVIFGHIGDGHLHVNILPVDAKELAEAKELYMDFAREAVRLGGSVSAEHGIGRIKRDFLSIQYPEQAIEQMKVVKRALDPGGTLNPGVLFPDD